MPDARDFLGDVLHVPGRQKLPLLDVDGAPGLGRGDQKIGLAAEEGRNLQHIDRLGHGRALLRQVHVGQHRAAAALAHLGEDRQAVLEPEPARAFERGAVRLVERGLVDEPDAEPRRQFDQRMAHLERMLPALERARPRDQHKRPVVAERELADGDGTILHSIS